MKQVYAAILCVGFAVLSLGHKFGWSQRDATFASKIGSIAYEIAAIIAALVAILSRS